MGTHLRASNEQIVNLFLGVAAVKLLREEIEEVFRSFVVPRE
jgi:hypothetical protein